MFIKSVGEGLNNKTSSKKVSVTGSPNRLNAAGINIFHRMKKHNILGRERTHVRKRIAQLPSWPE